MTPTTPLPIDVLLPDVCAALKVAPALVLQAAPGAGKTTRVPRALLEHGLSVGKEVVVLEPRRLATRLAAQRVAEEMGESVGATVGYQVRFEDVGGPKTRLRFVTEGVLTRRLLSSPDLSNVGVVVLDEFHERHLAGDISLALLRQLQARRSDLKLVVMSATLDVDPLSAYLGGCPILHSEGRRFEVDIEHLASADERPLHEQVLGALKRVSAVEKEGHVLVFLPGAAEIRRAQETCADFASRHGLAIHALHGDLPAADQDRTVRPSAGRKLILSTNVAETSVTIEGVTVVIDSGLARTASFSPWTGLPALKTTKVSRASAVQRAGRAGRTRSGRCVRLYTKHDFDGRAEHETPEIGRVDLAETVLSLRAMGVRDLATFPFFEAPPKATVESADALLKLIGAVAPTGDVTPLGKRLLKLPLHPRQARVIAEGEKRGVAEDATLCAALLGERDVRLEARAKFGPGHAAAKTTSGASDVLEMLDRMRTGSHVDARAVESAERVRRQLRRGLDTSTPSPKTAAAHDEALLQSLLAGFPDRVAKRRKPHSPDLLLFGGGTATLAESSVVREPDLMVALDVEEVGRGGKTQVVVRIASAVEAEWLLEAAPNALQDFDALEWNAAAERVERVTRLSYGPLVLEETRAPAPPSDDASRILAEAATAAGLTRFVEAEALARWTARMTHAAQASPGAGIPPPTAENMTKALTQLAAGMRSFRELREASLLDLLQSQLTSEQRRALDVAAPERITLAGGRGVQVNYEAGKPPWIESRLQDFFGSAQGPVLGQTRTPLVLHLLAPNYRAVQVTTDLAGFWDRHYPAIRKELARKYPRHSWPEDPRTAAPPVPGPRRPR